MINKNRIIFFIGMCILTLSFSSNIVYSDNVSKNLSVTLYGADILNAKEGRIEPVVIDISPFMENRSVQMVLVFGNPDEKIPLNETDFKVNTYPPILAVDDKVILNRYGILLPLTKFGSLLPISKESLAKHPGSEEILSIASR